MYQKKIQRKLSKSWLSFQFDPNQLWVSIRPQLKSLLNEYLWKKQIPSSDELLYDKSLRIYSETLMKDWISLKRIHKTTLKGMFSNIQDVKLHLKFFKIKLKNITPIWMMLFFILSKRNSRQVKQGWFTAWEDKAVNQLLDLRKQNSK